MASSQLNRRAITAGRELLTTWSRPEPGTATIHP